METNNICQQIANIHNTIAQAQVSGESILVLADAMVQCRNLIQSLRVETEKKVEKDGE